MEKRVKGNFIANMLSAFKRIIILLIFIMPNLGGQDKLSGSFGTVTIDRKVWNQVSIRPVTHIWNFNVAWDLTLYFNHDGRVYDDNWNFSSFKHVKNTALDKIYYLSFGRKSDPFYFKIGALDYVNLGYGILVSGYSNTVEYPRVKNIGLNMRARSQFGSVQGFVNDFKQNIGLFGLRLSSRKLLKIPMGVAIVFDRNQMLGLRDTDEDGFPDRVDTFPNNDHYWLDSDGDGLADNNPNEYDRDGDGLPDVDNLGAIHAFWDELGVAVGQDFSQETFYDSLPDPSVSLLPTPMNINGNPDRVSAISIDLGYPIYAQDNMIISVYAQIAQMIGTTTHPGSGKKINLGMGMVPVGLSSQFGPATIILEYRMIPKGQFEFAYWNQTYDLERVTFGTVSGQTKVLTKESKLGRFGDQKGLYTQFRIKTGLLFTVNMSYQNLIGHIWDDSEVDYVISENQSFLASVKLIKQIYRIKNAEIFYHQRNVPNPFKFEVTESTILGYRTGVEIGSGIELNCHFQRSFRDLDGDGDVNSPGETINLTTIETSFEL